MLSQREKLKRNQIYKCERRGKRINCTVESWGGGGGQSESLEEGNWSRTEGMYMACIPWKPFTPSRDRSSGPSPHTTKYSKILLCRSPIFSAKLKLRKYVLSVYCPLLMERRNSCFFPDLIRVPCLQCTVFCLYFTHQFT
jgi:hypothetical protein